MCENDAVAEKSEAKQVIPSPSASAGSLGKAKIFVLTPEILQKLGLKGYSNPKIASKAGGEPIKLSFPIVQKSDEAKTEEKTSKESVSTLGKLVKQSTSQAVIKKKPSIVATSVIKNSRIKNSSDGAKALKPSLPSDAEPKQVLNVVSQEKDVISPKGETPSKAKKIRQRSNAADLPNQSKGADKKNDVETNVEFDTAVSGVRTSKRVSKPKKFDDFILTENLFSHGRDAISEKPRSRRSSINSETPPQTTKSNKGGSAKAKEEKKLGTINVEAEGITIQKQTIEEILPEHESSETAKTISSADDVFTVPKSPTNVRRKSVDKMHEKRSSKVKKQQIQSTEPREEILSTEVGVTDLEQFDSGTKNDSPVRGDGFVVPDSSINEDKEKLYEAEEMQTSIGNMSETIVKKKHENASLPTTAESMDSTHAKRTFQTVESNPQSSSQEVKEVCDSMINAKTSDIRHDNEEEIRKLNSDSLRASDEEKIIFSNSESLTIPDNDRSIDLEEDFLGFSDKEEQNIASNSDPLTFLNKQRKNVESELEKKNIDRKSDSPRASEKEEKKISPKSNSPGASKKNEKSISPKADSLKALKKQRLDKNQRLVSDYFGKKQTITSESPPSSLDSNREVLNAKTNSLNCSAETEGESASKSQPSTKNDTKFFLTKQIQESPQKKEDAKSSKLNILKTVDNKNEGADIVTLDPPMSSDKSSEKSPKSDIASSPDNNEVIGIIHTDSPVLGKKEKVTISRIVSPASSMEMKDTSIKLNTSKSAKKNNEIIVIQSEASEETTDMEKHSIVSKSLDKKNKATVEHLPSARSSSVLQFASPKSSYKSETTVTNSQISNILNEKEETSISQLDSLKTSDEKDEITPSKKTKDNSMESHTPKSSIENEETIVALQSDSPVSSNVSSISKENILDPKKQPIASRSFGKKKRASVVNLASSRSSRAKRETSILQFAPSTSDKTEDISSKSDTAISQNTKEEISISPIASPISSDKKEEVRIPQCDSQASLLNIDNSETKTDSASSLDEKEKIPSPKSPIKTVEVDISPRSTAINEEIMDTQIDSLQSDDIIEEITVYEFESPWPPDNGEDTVYIESNTLSPDKSQVNTESLNTEMDVDAPDNTESCMSNEISTLNDTSCYVEIDGSANDTSLNEEATVETVETDDAIFAETTTCETTESPIPQKAELENRRSRRSSIKSSVLHESTINPEMENQSEIDLGKPVKMQKTESRSQRSRRSVELPVTLETENQMEIESTSTVEEPVKITSRRKRSVRTNEDVTDGKGLSDGSEDDAERVELRPRRRGRPPGIISRGSSRKRGRGRGRGRGGAHMDTEYVPRAAASSKEKSVTEENASIDNSEQKTDEPPKADEIECGKCKLRVEKKKWSTHNFSKHNNLGWISGDPEPDFDKNLKLLRSILSAVFKRKKKTQLTCETCGDGKRSVNGFISHIQFCGKTEDERASLMMTCPVCQHVMMPSSMEMHERAHRDENKAAMEKKLKGSIEILESSTRGKRKAAEKAEKKISEFTNLVKDDEPAARKRRRTKEELIDLIEKPQNSGNPPNRYKGIWNNEIAKTGEASCRHQGCTFKGNSITIICSHHFECSFAPRSNYVCKICLFSSTVEEEAMKHAETEHAVGKSTEVGDSDFENSESSSSSETDSELSDTKTRSHKKQDRFEPQHYNVAFLDNEIKVDSRWPFTFPAALRWTMEFECKNYRLRLFEDLLPNSFKLLDNDESLEYLPELTRSMQIRDSDGRSSTSARWKQWERFEGSVHSGIPTCFAGGPVWAIAWLPIPAPMYNKDVDQFVAISTHSSMESDYEVGKSYEGKNVIQIWNLGPLDHSKSSARNAPVLSYGVAHNKGTIWCMEWCPSGCYEDPILLNSEEDEEGRTSKKRMGLLATACSDGCVYVYSLPFPDELDFKDNGEDSQLPIYAAEPILALSINSHMYEQGEHNWQCTKLNWSKELGHDTIIAGFSNGQVALWDLASKSHLFTVKRGETTFIDAFQHIYAHGHAISAVQMIPYGGKRFFMTSSYDRMSKLWDLEDTSFPITTLKRGITLDGTWLTHWAAWMTAYDDVLTHANTYLISLRQPGAKFFPLLPTNSPTYSIASSDFGNSVGHGTLAGEVIVMFPSFLWNPRDMERVAYKKRWMASAVEVVDLKEEKTSSKKRKKSTEYDYLPETYEECKDRFGLVFRDSLVRSQGLSRKSGSKPSLFDKLKPVQVEQYPFASANRISWNPNAWSYLWMCVGYQNGIVRFLNFNTVNLEKDMRKLLPSHARNMLKEEMRKVENFDTSLLDNTTADS